MTMSTTITAYTARIARASAAAEDASTAKFDSVNNRRRTPITDRATHVQRQPQFVRLVAGGIVPGYQGTERDIAYSGLRDLHRSIFTRLNQLLASNLSGIRLGSDRIDEITFRRLIRLIALDSSYISPTHIDMRTFRDVFFLRTLNLRNNTINRIDSNAFLPLYNLHTLEPSKNRLHQLGMQLFNGPFVLNRKHACGDSWENEFKARTPSSGHRRSSCERLEHHQIDDDLFGSDHNDAGGFLAANYGKQQQQDKSDNEILGSSDSIEIIQTPHLLNQTSHVNYVTAEMVHIQNSFSGFDSKKLKFQADKTLWSLLLDGERRSRNISEQNDSGIYTVISSENTNLYDESPEEKRTFATKNQQERHCLNDEDALENASHSCSNLSSPKRKSLTTSDSSDKDRRMQINEGNPVATSTLSSESMITSVKSFGDDSTTLPKCSLPLSTLFIEDCVYRGEGNANVVIALPQERKVIRFRKSLPHDVSSDSGKQRIEQEVKYVKFVALYFLGQYTQIPEILRYDAKDITKLSEAIRSLRSVPQEQTTGPVAAVSSGRGQQRGYDRGQATIERRRETSPRQPLQEGRLHNQGSESKILRWSPE
ncbi:hypothetical protein WN51_10020 [Melipona quadrifasciata]|uniref:Inositol-pentakisphosphate 2-kinase n=1 Tax=Melipona quadrifasciata TaxID=166423 RepID=A0A0M9ABE8_9HYME|nr:hypothetical protein WN51_10020 [Melipona quadrifasciata]